MLLIFYVYISEEYDNKNIQRNQHLFKIGLSNAHNALLSAPFRLN